MVAPGGSYGSEVIVSSEEEQLIKESRIKNEQGNDASFNTDNSLTVPYN